MRVTEVKEMDNLESSSDSEKGFRINKDYAEKYNKWRQREELQKLKDKYGDVLDDDESTLESEDEDAEALTDKLDNQWLQTLTALKRKDPQIYDKNTKFYDKSSDSDAGEKHSNLKNKKIKKEKPYLLKDYERDLIVEKGGILSDSNGSEDEEEETSLPKSYYQEQDEIKRIFKSASKEIDDSDSEEEFLTKRNVSKKERDKEDEEYNKWLKEQVPEKGKLVGIDPWDKTNMNGDEEFLRDYILNKRYVDDSDDERIPTYDEIVNVDEEEDELDKQETFERKFNFRYEEPDQEFIKSYPRTLGESVRRKDDRRTRKRQEAKERKLKENEKKKQELKQLKNLKKREIMDKIELIKEVTGNTDIGFAPEDIEEDFDPDKYDKMMKNAFSNDYYDEDADEAKPVFDDDEELGLDVENWDEWTPGNEERYDDEETYDNTNRDISWDAEQESGSKKGKRRSKFAKAVAKEKPVFDPNDKTFEEYLDEYYNLDYEDMVGDQPCRFKYRSVVPNDFGLTTDDIIKAKEKELNQWVSVKRMSQYRTKEEELIDVRIYRKKSKRKANVLTSLKDAENGSQAVQKNRKKGRAKNEDVLVQRKGQRKKIGQGASTVVNENKSKKRKADVSEIREGANQSNGGFVKTQKLSIELGRIGDNVNSNKGKNGVLKKKNKREKNKGQHDKTAMSDERLKAYGINPKKFKFIKAKYMKK